MRLVSAIFFLRAVLAAENSIVLKFGDNSVRIENDGDTNTNENQENVLQTNANRKEEEKCASGQCLPEGYNKMVMPLDVNVVETSFELRDIIEVDDDRFTITFSMYFGQQWKEPRLKNINNDTIPNWLPLDLDFAEQLWIPNIFIYDLKEFKVIHVLNKLAALFVVKEGELFYQQAVHVKFFCKMRFENFPVDEHICTFRVGSSSYNSLQMVFETSKLEYVAENQNTILDYKAQITGLEDEEKMLIYGDIGNFSISGFRINLQRHMTKYIWNYHFPSGIFVMVSWVSFIIPAGVVPGRMGLLVTLFLVLANMFNSINSNSPTVEGMTSIGLWMISCILFVFGALAEYAGILYLKSKLEEKGKRGGSQLDPRTINMNKDKCDQWIVSIGAKFPKNDPEIGRFDRMFLMIFPTTFLLFNFVFWTNVLNSN